MSGEGLKRRSGGYGRTMRRSGSVVGLLAAVLLVLAACEPAPVDQKAHVDQLLHQSAWMFVASASNANYRAQYPWLDFSTDGCSNWFLPDHLNDTGLTFDFTAACWHHDFGYRNYKRFKAAGIIPDVEASRQRIDDMFYDDMRMDCARRPAWMRPTCGARADMYYMLARGFGTL